MSSKHVLVPIERFENLLELERKSFRELEKSATEETSGPEPQSPQLTEPRHKVEVLQPAGEIKQSPCPASSTEITESVQQSPEAASSRERVESVSRETPGDLKRVSQQVTDLKGSGDSGNETDKKRLRPPGVRQNSKWMTWN